MENFLLSMLAVIVSVMLLLFTAGTFVQGTSYNEEYMQQHDGGDRAEYLQEMEHDDP
jgi:hypothetical protein